MHLTKGNDIAYLWVILVRNDNFTDPNFFVGSETSSWRQLIAL